MRLHGKVAPSLIIGVLAVLILAGCGAAASGSGAKSATSPPAAGGGSGTGGGSVAIHNFAFTPQILTVKVGTTVTWTNNDSAPHTVTSASSMSTSATRTGLFDSGTLNPGQTFSFTFTKPGTYFYECTIHFAMPSMHAKVVVK